MREHWKFVLPLVFFSFYLNNTTNQVIEKRKVQYPERPLIRISSTFFWHLSSDYDLAPIPELAVRAQTIREEQAKLGRDDGQDTVYEAMKVGQQVSK